MRRPHERRLRLEPLEDRNLLAVFSVDNLADAGAGSLRQAIEDANAAAGADVIEFQAGLSGTILLSTGEMLITDELTIDGPGASELTIDAQQNSRIFHITEASGPVTISGLTFIGGRIDSNMNAYGGAILSDTNAKLSISNSTISGNSVITPAIGSGGGLFAAGDVAISFSSITENTVESLFNAYGGGVASSGEAVVLQSTISGNVATGDNITDGGGIYAYDLKVIDSSVSNNSTSAVAARGGGIGSHNATVSDSMIFGNAVSAIQNASGGGVSGNAAAVILDSMIIGNSVSGGSATGGGIRAGDLATVIGSTVSENSLSAIQTARGGGIFTVLGSVATSDSAISGNIASVTDGRGVGGGIGGGIYGNVVLVTNTTISGNSALGDSIGAGGGIRARAATVRRSTITGNVATGGSSTFVSFGGGGIWNRDDSLVIEDSIVADNETDDGTFTDVNPTSSPLTIRHSLIGDNTDTGFAEAPVGMPDANGNLIGDPAGAGIIDPMLGPLGDNGGPTFTHALLPGSPAIDAGDPAFVPPPFIDQRGFLRVADGGGGVKRIDMGAFEFAAMLAGDGNGDGIVGSQDYTIWANNFGISGEDVPGDYNGDGIVGPQDYTIWANNHGNMGPPATAVAAGLLTEPQIMSRSGDRDITIGDRETASTEPSTLAARSSTPMLGVPPMTPLRAARDMAIEQIASERFAGAPLSNVDAFWALLHAGLISTNEADTDPSNDDRGFSR